MPYICRIRARRRTRKRAVSHDTVRVRAAAAARACARVVWLVRRAPPREGCFSFTLFLSSRVGDRVPER